MKHFLTAILLCIWVIGQSYAQDPTPKLISWKDITELPAPVPGQRIAYGPDTLQFGELRMPEGRGPFPVVVLIHGGCWLNQFNYQYMSHLSAALTQAGYATWNVEFRRVGDEGGGWPGTFLDVGKAIDHVGLLTKQYALDKKSVVLMGHSAGGHLALWAATRHKLSHSSPLYQKNPLKVKGVVTLAGITDLAAYAQKTGSCNAAVEKLMGGAPAQVAERYKETSPKGRIPMKMSVKLVQGQLDPIVPLRQAQALAYHSSYKNYWVKLMLLPNLGHFDLVAPASSAWPIIQQAVLDVLENRHN